MLGSDQRFATLPALIFLTRRSRLGLNATQFGRLLGVSGSRVADFEAGRRMPNPRHLAKLAELVGVSAEAVRTLAISALVEQILRRGASSLERLHERVVRGIESLADLRPLGQK
ncbi:MAG: helix-turn-helix domain-containing protein [Candidatus Methylomirabilales bacterium]